MSLTFDEVLKKIRRYRKDSVIEVGGRLIWKIYNEGQGRKIDNILLIAYGERVVLLAMACCNNHRNLIISEKQFKGLLIDFISLEKGLSDEKYMDDESQEIYLGLQKVNLIPVKYIEYSAIRSFYYCTEMARLAFAQNLNHNHLQEFYTAFAIISKVSDQANFRAIFNIDVIRLFRCLFGLLANTLEKNGITSIGTLNLDDNIRSIFDIYEDDVSLVAYKCAYKESDIISWRDKIKAVAKYEAQYIPMPTQTFPFIERNVQNLYSILSPYSFFGALKERLCTVLYENNPRIDIGDVIEEHILSVLKEVLPENAIQRIAADRKHGDFLISLDTMNVVIELKTSVGSFDARMLMRANDIVGMWNKLYAACVQAAESKRTISNSNPTYVILLIADHIVGETMHFENFAKATGIYRDLELEIFCIMPWSLLENWLSYYPLEAIIAKQFHDIPFPAPYNPLKEFNYVREAKEILGF